MPDAEEYDRERAAFRHRLGDFGQELEERRRERAALLQRLGDFERPDPVSGSCTEQAPASDEIAYASFNNHDTSWQGVLSKPTGAWARKRGVDLFEKGGSDVMNIT